jgi:hypothetical protein
MYEIIQTVAKKKRGQYNQAVATADEIKAAVAGKLSPRKATGNDAQGDLIRTGRNGMPVGRPIGTSTGLPINMAIAYIFQQNEKARSHKKLTDTKIAEWLRHEFPGRSTERWNRVQEMRTQYNAGKMTRGKLPRFPSHRYDSGGEMIDPKRRGTNGGRKAAA